MTASPVILSQLSALADPIRARLVALLAGRELTVTELVVITQLPQSTVSRHLRVLADLDWVESRAEGTSRWYRLDEGRLGSDAAAVWATVREPLAATPAARRDFRRLQEVLQARRDKSREFFSAAASRWDRLREELFGPRAAAPALAALLDPRWVVGDLGCGTGEVTLALAPFVAEVVAVDAAREMLETARSRVAHQANVSFHCAELEALPLDPGTLDAAVIALVLHHVADPGRVVAEARRVLRPGAPLVIVDMMPHEHEEYREEMGHLWLGFSEREVRRMLVEAGCAAESVRHQPLPADPRARGPGLFVAVGR